MPNLNYLPPCRTNLSQMVSQLLLKKEAQDHVIHVARCRRPEPRGTGLKKEAQVIASFT